MFGLSDPRPTENDVEFLWVGSGDQKGAFGFFLWVILWSEMRFCPACGYRVLLLSARDMLSVEV